MALWEGAVLLFRNPLDHTRKTWFPLSHGRITKGTLQAAPTLQKTILLQQLQYFAVSQLLQAISC